MSRRRALGAVLLDLERVLEEMVDAHELQWGDVVWLVWGWLMVHRPDARERYRDGSSPELRYEPRD